MTYRSLRVLIPLCLLLLANPARSFAHARGMGTLDIHEQPGHLLLTWTFYYDELPPILLLPKELGATAADIQEIKQNLASLSGTAFRIGIGNQALPAPRITQILVLPDKTCLVILSYSAPANAPIRIESPILHLLPPNYLINVRFKNPAGKPSGTLITLDTPPLTISIPVENAGASDTSPRAAFWRAFAGETGAPWIHTNWILLTLLLIVSIPASRAYLLLLTAVLVRVPMTHLWFGKTYLLPEIVLCLPITLLAWLVTRPKPRLGRITAATILSALVYTNYDLEFRVSDFSLPTMLGQDIGFAAGLLLAAAILSVLNLELAKFLTQHKAWRPRLCWGIAGVSLWLALYNSL